MALARSGRDAEAMALADDETLAGGFRVDIRLALARAQAESGNHPAALGVAHGLPELVKGAHKGWPDK